MTTVYDATTPAATQASTSRRAETQRTRSITVNGIVIPRDVIARETQHHPSAQPTEAWLAAARALAIRELLLQEARRIGITPEPMADGEGRSETDEEALVRKLVALECRAPEPDEATCRRIYDQNRARYRSDDLYAVRHILISASPDDEQMRSDARRTAERIIEAVITEPASFARHAAAASACPSRAMGGSLGQIGRGQTVPEFETALATAPIGIVCPTPVETRYGFHVVQVDQRIDGVQLPFEIAHPRIAEWLSAKAERSAIRSYISMLVGTAEIQGIDFPRC